jgi:hypothetical protein
MYLSFVCTSRSMTAFTPYAVGVIILILLSSILANVACAQIFPNSQDNRDVPASSSPPSRLQQQPSSQPKLHLVKITSPHKDQQVPVGKDLIISGTSSDNATSNCKVSVKVNFVSPYHDATANGPGGQNDYSNWGFVLTPAYTTIRQGQNKIIAEFLCPDNPSLLSKTSVNVTGVTIGANAATNSSELQTSSTPTTTGGGFPLPNSSGISSSNNIGSSQSTSGSSHHGASSGRIINELKHSKIIK